MAKKIVEMKPGRTVIVFDFAKDTTAEQKKAWAEAVAQMILAVEPKSQASDRTPDQ